MIYDVLFLGSLIHADRVDSFRLTYSMSETLLFFHSELHIIY